MVEMKERGQQREPSKTSAGATNLHRAMLSLKHFILQQRVLHLYRRAIRASRCTTSNVSLHPPSHHSAIGIPDSRTRAETLLWFRTEIERNKHLTNTVSAYTRPHSTSHAAQVAIENQLNMATREIRQLFPGHSSIASNKVGQDMQVH